MLVIKHVLRLMWKVFCAIWWPLTMYCLSGFTPQRRGKDRSSCHNGRELKDRRELANWLYWSDMDDRG